MWRLKIGPLTILLRHVAESDDEYGFSYVTAWWGYKSIMFREW